MQFWIFCVFFISFFWNGGLTYAQNLIPNAGFENWDGTTGPGASSLDGLLNWYNANGTVDHHHTSLSGNNLTGLDPCPLGQGAMDCGYTIAGESVIGCWKGNGDGSREWAGVQLTQPLESGACYKVSFWIQNKEDNPDFLYETNQWGVFFSETQFPAFSVNVTDYTSRLDQIVMTEEVVGDTIWHYFEFDYQANEAYQYAYFGYQGNVATSTFTAANSTDPLLGFYAWFDEVSIVKITSELTVSNDTIICSGDSVLVTANSNSPVVWSHLAPDTVSSFWATPQTTTTFYVRTQGTTDCSILDSIVIGVNQEEEVEFPAEEVICLGSGPFILDPNPNDGIWVGPGIVDASTSLFDANIAGVGPHEIYFISNNDCRENFTLELQVLETPILDFESDVSAGCTPLEVTFTDLTPITGPSYNWDFGNGGMSNETSSTTTTYSEPGNYDVGLSVTYSDYCAATISNSNFIQVGETPSADFSYSPTEITNLNPRVQFENLSSLNVTNWFWSFDNGNSSTQRNPFYEFLQPGIYDVQLFVATNEGCQDSVTQILTITNQINFYIPNVFSPNGDGVNDFFEIFPIGLVESYQITIFDRWGETVFKSTDLMQRWNGSVKGEPGQEGVYIYMLEYQFMDFINNGLKSGVLSGDVTILK